MASPAISYARNNQQRFLSELKDLLRIPSVSTAPEHKSDVQRAADYVASELRRIGLENVEVINGKGHPLNSQLCRALLRQRVVDPAIFQ